MNFIHPIDRPIDEGTLEGELLERSKVFERKEKVSLSVREKECEGITWFLRASCTLAPPMDLLLSSVIGFIFEALNPRKLGDKKVLDSLKGLMALGFSFSFDGFRSVILYTESVVNLKLSGVFLIGLLDTRNIAIELSNASDYSFFY
ncbi:hypothetical protein IEQ34_003145 [Dendrobium chrysotoxum]|uniref:Uncharacterized protein n=1 Tax=Dendrobium chrysotoxum TaxID=161865 RepID=A0AAV7HIF6_DENCH|nr:hypothetical protein IEQ34_003145 [Dendrobium chrysotoxum]